MRLAFRNEKFKEDKGKDDEELSKVLDEEIASDLLESLSIEEKEEEFECPLCGTLLPIKTKKCSNCDTVFLDIITEGDEIHIKPSEKEIEIAMGKAEGIFSKRNLSSINYINIVIIATIISMLLIFILFRMYPWENLSVENVFLLIGVGITGALVSLVFSRLSVSTAAKGDSYFKDEKYKLAISKYDRAIKMSVRPASIWASKGAAFKRLGRYDKALRCNNIATNIDPKNEIAWSNKGDVLFKVEMLENAVKCYDRALKIKPDYAVAWNNKGRALAKLGKFAHAESCYKNAINYDSKYIAAWLNRGEVLLRLGKRKEASACYKYAKNLSSA